MGCRLKIVSSHMKKSITMRFRPDNRRRPRAAKARLKQLWPTAAALSFAFVTQIWWAEPSYSEEIRDHRTRPPEIRDHRTPPSPDSLACLPRSAVTCSTDWLQVSPPVAAYSQVFQDACVLHDYCYRFGHATYGYSQKDCDDYFLDDASDICDDTTFWDVATLGLTKLACHNAKLAFYSAARAFGKGPFQERGTVCDYEAVTGRRPTEGTGTGTKPLGSPGGGQKQK